MFCLVAVLFLANFDSPEVIFEQLSMIYSIPRCAQCAIGEEEYL
jgi:hypothetical protein